MRRVWPARRLSQRRNRRATGRPSAAGESQFLPPNGAAAYLLQFARSRCRCAARKDNGLISNAPNAPKGIATRATKSDSRFRATTRIRIQIRIQIRVWILRTRHSNLNSESAERKFRAQSPRVFLPVPAGRPISLARRSRARRLVAAPDRRPLAPNAPDTAGRVTARL